MNIVALVDDFAKQVIAATEAAAVQRVQAALSAAFGTSQKRKPGSPKKGVAVVAVKKARKTSPKVARARKLQGQYLGALRGLGPAGRAKVKAVARAKGVAQAVRMANAMKKQPRT